MKKKVGLLVFSLLAFTVTHTHADFQSDRITGTGFCIGISCITDWSVFQRALPGVLVVSNNSLFTGLKQAVDWINTSGTQAYQILIDAGNWDIKDTITVNSSYPVAIVGMGFEATSLHASGGLANKPMFDIKSPFDIFALNIDGSTLAGYGVNPSENGFKITGVGKFIHFDSVGVYGFNKGISAEANSDIQILNAAITNNSYGVYMSGGDCTSVGTRYYNTVSNVSLYAGSGNSFLSNQDEYLTDAGAVAVTYYPNTYIYYHDISIFNNDFDGNGTILSGFDFTLARDANVEVHGNIGMEDYRPHAKINLVAGATAQSFSSNTWRKVNFTLTDSYVKKRGITTTGRLTFLSNHMKSVQMRISASVLSSTQPADIMFAIVKNGDTDTQYGRMNVYIDSTSKAFGFSTNVYLDDVMKNDYFELYAYSSGSETLTLQNLAWYTDSR